MEIIGYIACGAILIGLTIFIIVNAISIYKEISKRLKQKKNIKEDKRNDSN